MRALRALRREPRQRGGPDRRLPENITRADLQHALPPGAARNAVDCALWDWEAKRTGRRVWELAGLPAPGPVITAFTLSLDTPEGCEAAAARHAHRPLLKIKLGTPDDMPRLEAVREGAPNARLIVDANEGWTAEVYADFAPHLLRLGVALVEQPLPAADDAALIGDSPAPCRSAPTKAATTAPRSRLAGKYDMVNVKLDKTGGLTEALALRDAARARASSSWSAAWSAPRSPWPPPCSWRRAPRSPTSTARSSSPRTAPTRSPTTKRAPPARPGALGLTYSSFSVVKASGKPAFRPMSVAVVAFVSATSLV
jgi:hypothetical protein